MRPSVAPLTDVSSWARGNGLEVVLIVLGTLLLARLVRWFSAQVTAQLQLQDDNTDEVVRSEAFKHRRALAQVVTWTSLALLYSVAAVLIVQRLGLPLTGFVAPATVIGVALGFGAQQVVQDLLSGFFMMSERQYGFGDLVRISVIGVPNPVLGTVEDISLRITTVRSANGEVVVTPNGQMVQVTNLSRDWARAVIDVPVSVSVDITRASDVLRAMGVAALADKDLHVMLLDPPSVMGVESLDVDQLSIRIVARTLPGKQFEVGRALRLRIARAFLAEGITP